MEKKSTSSVPVFDLQNFPGKYEKGLKEACEEWGCFRLVNHTIPISLMSDMKTVVSSLFDLPIAIKKNNIPAIFGSGYIGRSQSNPLYEALGLYDIGSNQAVQQFCSQLGVSNHQRSVIEAYVQGMNDLAMEILEKLAKTMGLSGYSFEGWPMLLRINKYNFIPEAVGTVGVQLHTDAVFLTLLQDDENVSGLEVINSKSGEYVPVDPVPGGIIVNFGDVGTAWSNGRFCNVKHRVQCKEASTRLSIASFVMGPREGPVEAPAELVDDQHPRLYAPFTWEDYRKLRFTAEFRIIDSLGDVLIQHKNE